MSAITEAARGRNCTMRLPGVCNHDPATSVWSHINSVRWGAGRGHKAPDICGLITCFECANALDGRRRKSDDGQPLDREFVKLCAYEGHLESLAILDKEGFFDAPDKIAVEVFQSPLVQSQAD
jgi:hypothetical protein